ncbi:glycosyltransferase family 39 protein [Alcaligenaceae bacterium CGII-47]|nr:glycosyltransferase family 39 protein [Alcaligenaceae bacterium CGII-47]
MSVPGLGRIRSGMVVLYEFTRRGLAHLLALQSVWWISILTFVWLAATTWAYPLLLPDEGRYVGVAWHMLGTGDYLTPMLNGMPFFHKPPLFYWLTAASLSVFGVNAWAARLCSVLIAALLVGLLYRFLRIYANQRIAILSAVILSVQPFLFGAAHYANLDMLVGGIMSMTVIAGATAVFQREAMRSDRVAVLCMMAAAALGFLAKGLIGVVLPGGVLFFWLLGRRRFAAMRHLLWWPGIVLFFALSLPWMVIMEVRYGGFFDYYIVYQHFERFLETGFNNPHPFWFYIPVILGLTLPWSVQLWRWARADGPRDTSFVPPAERIEQVGRGVMRGLMLSWLLVILVFFSIPSSKLVGYVIAALPPLAWFIAEVFEARWVRDPLRAERTLVISILIAVGICGLAVLAMVFFPQPSNRPLAQLLAQSARPGDRLVMLERYAYDVPLYAGRTEPAIVVTNWQDPDLLHSDDWRRELYDAGTFVPALAQRILWQPERLRAALCEADRPTYWILGRRSVVDQYPFLQRSETFDTGGRMLLWRLSSDTPLKLCAETPKTDPE